MLLTRGFCVLYRKSGEFYTLLITQKQNKKHSILKTNHIMNHIAKIFLMFQDYGFIVKSIKEVYDNNSDPSIGFSIIAMRGPKWIGCDPYFFMRNYAYNYKEEIYIDGEEYEEILESHEIPDETPYEAPGSYIQRKRREFLEETAAHFSVNPRAIDSNDSCVYSHSVNGGCAIGRKVSKDLAYRFDYMGAEVGYNFTVSSKPVFDLLPLELSMLGDSFLQDCQYLHDNNNNWDKKELSPQGKTFFDIIVERYC